MRSPVRFLFLTVISLASMNSVVMAQQSGDAGINLGPDIANIESTARDYEASPTPAAFGAEDVSLVPPPTHASAPSGAPPEPEFLYIDNLCGMVPGDIGGRDAIFDDNVSGCLLGFRPDQAPEQREGRDPRGPQPPGPGRIIDRVIELVAAPELEIAPSEIGLTGLETYVWIEEPRPVGVTAAAGGTTVEARASPTQYLWDWGDGNDTLTYSSGRAWTEHSPGTIEHVYETIGRYDLSVEVVWEAQWRINGGGWRALGLFSLRDGVDYPVRQVQSRLTRSDG
jgi:hypothetical protein